MIEEPPAMNEETPALRTHTLPGEGLRIVRE